MAIVVVEPAGAEQIDAVRSLLREHAAGLGFELCFQDFEQELIHLPRAYAPPEGRLMMAVCGDRAAGCVGLRRIDQACSEMKRLYVRPAFRGRGLGRFLAEAVIREAREIGYQWMLLATAAPRMQDALTLYRSLGFKETRPATDNPLPDASYMELDLRHGASARASRQPTDELRADASSRTCLLRP